MRVLNLVTNHRATFYENQLSTLDRQGVESVTLSVPGRFDGDGEVNDRSPVDYLRFYPSVLRRSFEDFDLIHANYGLTAPFALAQPNLPVVLSLWGSDLFGRFGPVSKPCAPHCDAVIVMSEAMAEELGSECVVIPHGVDTDAFAPRPREEARRELGWRDDSRHVLFPYPPSQTVKDFPRARRIVERARERLADPVELQTISGVPHQRMPTYMNAADAFLLTSRHEGSPNAVKEALACNLPVVSTDVGDVRERLSGVSPSFVRSDDEGLLEALVTVLERGERSNGRERIEALSLARMGERIRSVYETVADP